MHQMPTAIPRIKLPAHPTTAFHRIDQTHHIGRIHPQRGSNCHLSWRLHTSYKTQNPILPHTHRIPGQHLLAAIAQTLTNALRLKRRRMKQVSGNFWGHTPKVR